MEIEIMELYLEYLDILIKKKKKGLELDEVETKFIEKIEEFDKWFMSDGIGRYL